MQTNTSNRHLLPMPVEEEFFFLITILVDLLALISTFPFICAVFFPHFYLRFTLSWLVHVLGF